MPEIVTLEGSKAEISSFVNDLPAERYRVQFMVVDVSASEIDYLAEAVRRTTMRTASEIDATRQQILAQTTSPRELPPEQTILDAVTGQWPGQESDAEIRAALERLS